MKINMVKNFKTLLNVSNYFIDLPRKATSKSILCNNNEENEKSSVKVARET